MVIDYTYRYFGVKCATGLKGWQLRCCAVAVTAVNGSSWRLCSLIPRQTQAAAPAITQWRPPVSVESDHSLHAAQAVTALITIICVGRQNLPLPQGSALLDALGVIVSGALFLGLSSSRGANRTLAVFDLFFLDLNQDVGQNSRHATGGDTRGKDVTYDLWHLL